MLVGKLRIGLVLDSNLLLSQYIISASYCIHVRSFQLCSSTTQTIYTRSNGWICINIQSIEMWSCSNLDHYTQARQISLAAISIFTPQNLLISLKITMWKNAPLKYMKLHRFHNFKIIWSGSLFVGWEYYFHLTFLLLQISVFFPISPADMFSFKFFFFQLI